MLYEKIPNFIIVTGLILGVLYRLLIVHERRIGVLFLYLFFPFFLFFAFFIIKAIGAGDIKLFMITGLFLGTETNLFCIGLALLAAVCWGLVRLILSHKLLSRIKTLLLYIGELYRHMKYKSRGAIPYMDGERLSPTAGIHLSLPILFGTLVSAILIS